ncbi:HopJ type III effector protein [Psychrobium sp. 1_MG-2023]|uniref:HopJ type III effector protein n=1 Tax=Psychrobium sp. 1_MG-2023 TaxID=3062624 RepID=UPI000C34B8DE|nr:HopJ type III effector protein [Psychrobium sp. 1_MG-2023]MDP2560662.1 HopJ type III effector protein [Psychrobium sp. 1_MG-2023]PKF56558.1 type III effector [Alteromonadales bacterium alter-6D02]
MKLNQLIELINDKPTAVEFSLVMDVINDNYHYTATDFTNGDIKNQAGTNEGSCKIFAFAQLNALTTEQTLACFGDYYRKDVLENPHGQDHLNIRNFIQHGWAGISFKAPALAVISE